MTIISDIHLHQFQIDGIEKEPLIWNIYYRNTFHIDSVTSQCSGQGISKNWVPQ